MKTVTASNANRNFSALLRDVARGERVLVTSRGRPVASIVPPELPIVDAEREKARQELLEHLRKVRHLGPITWVRDDLYER
jgi:prevent-host-death family protein